MRADVQLEHGYLRIANRLAEALLHAGLSPMQFRIMHALIRLTYGWGRKTVTVSQGELATYCDASSSGQFRQALRDLTANGVVLQLETGGGRTKSTLAIQKDFTKWGRYQVGPDRLASIFGRRPDSDDSLMRQADLFIDAGAQGDCEQAGTVTDSRQAPCLPAGIPTGSNSLSREELQARKDSEIQGKTEEQPIAERGGQPEAEATLREVMGPMMGDVLAFLDQRPAEHRGNWYPELLQIIGPATGTLPEDLAGACRDALIADPPCTSPVGIRAFVRRRKVERLTASIPVPAPPAAPSTSPREDAQRARDAADDAVWHQALEVVGQFKAGTMTAEAFAALPFPLRHALRMAGGWRAIHETLPGKLSFVRRDFLRSYHSAPAESSSPTRVSA